MATHSPKNCPRCGTVFSAAAPGDPCPRCVGAFAFGSGSEALEADLGAPVLHLGDFELLQEIGRGAMGVVFRSRQQSLNREVAVKIVLAGQFAGDSEKKRFLAEAEAAGRLDHSNIVPIYAVGEQDHRQFYAMKLVEGLSLSDCKAAFSAPEKAAHLLAVLADAVHHAHQRGILHRDLKPGNILIDSANQPHITDFGLARRLDHDGGLTVSGTPLGTPAYMAPEQADGNIHPTTAADIYSLGAILYELLAGRPPFVGKSIAEVLRQIAEEAVPSVPLERWSRGRTRDLVTICFKCLQKDPAHRYASAAELKLELESWLHGRPIRARPVSSFERLRYWSKRRPGVAALSASLSALILIVAIAAPLFSLRLLEAKKREEEAKNQAQSRLYQSLLSEARALRLTREPGKAQKGLDAIRAAAAIKVTPELRDEALAQLALSDHTIPTNVHRNIFLGRGVVINRAFDRIAAPERDGSFAVRDRATDRELFRWAHSATNVYPKPLTFSRDGRWLVSSASPKLTHIFEADSGKLLLGLEDTWFGSFSPDSTMAATLLHDNEWIIYDLPVGTIRTRFPVPRGSRASGVFHPDPRGSLLAYAEGNTTVIWDFSRHRVMDRLNHEARIFDLDWSGDLLVAGLENGSVRVWNVRSRKMETWREHTGVVDGIRFLPDGRLLTTHSYDGSSMWWDRFSGTPLIRDTALYPTLISADGGRVHLAGFSSWAEGSISQPKHYKVLNSAEATRFTISSDGRWILANSPQGFEILELSSGKKILSDENSRILQMLFTKDGKSLLALTRQDVSLYPLVTGVAGLELGLREVLYTSEFPDLEALALSEDGSEALLTGGMERFLSITLADAKVFRWFTGSSIPRSPRKSPGGEWYAAGTFHGRGARVWNATNEAQTKWLHSGNSTVGFSPDGTKMYSAVSDRVVVYQVGSWKILHEEPTESGTSLPGFALWSPQGRFLAFIRKRSEIVLIDSKTWRQVGRLTSPDRLAVQSVVWHPSGDRIVVLLDHGRIEVWELAGLKSELASLGIPWAIEFERATLPPPPPTLAEAMPLEYQAAFPQGSRPSPFFPKRSAQATARQIDLAPFYNAALDEDWHATGDRRNSLAAFPAGLLTLDGVAFDARGIIQLTSASLSSSRTRYPKSVPGIPINQKAQKLHFLLACGFANGELHEEAGKIVLYRGSGPAATISLKVGDQLTDWWKNTVETSLRPAWTGLTPSGQPVRLFHFEWSNPLPQVPLSTLDFSSSMRGAAPFLVALTVE